MRFLTLLFATLVLLQSPSLAQEDRFPPVTDVASSENLAERLALPFASGLAGAADAPVFAWVKNARGVRNVMVARAGETARRLTDYGADDGIEIYGLALSPDGTKLAFVRGGDASFADDHSPNTGQAVEAPDQTVYLANLASGAAPRAIGRGHDPSFSPDGRSLLFVRSGTIMVSTGEDEARRVADLRGNAGDFSWSPDGTRILFRELRSGHSIVGVVDIARASLHYLGATLGHSSDPAFSPDGQAVAFIQFRDAPARFDDSRGSFWSVRVADLATGDVRTVWSAPEGEGGQYYGTRGRNLFWTASGHLLFPHEGSGWLHVMAVPATGGPAHDLTPDANEVENFVPTPDGRGVVYSANPGDLDSRTLWQVDIASGADRRLTDDGQFAFFPVFGGTRLAATLTDARSPAHMVLIDTMEALGPKPSVAAYPGPQTVRFTAEDGTSVHGQYFRGVGEGPRPALIFAHGGPRRQMIAGFHPIFYYHNTYIRNQEFAAQGYDVLSVNFRSGTNYGRAFREAPGTGREGASEYQDILAGARWLAARPGVDPARIGIWGGSWGGYLAALALARDSDLFGAGVDLHGVHAMVRPVPDTYAPDEALAIQQLQWESSPMGAIEDWRSPVLLIHGDDDQNVDYRQSLLLARELTARGVPFEELAIPNERHDFFRYESWLESLEATGDFFDRTLEQAR
ncbi:S9 family peptidase [Alteriqipengyuania lutimaris]|uniref:S9 family peptidase n=1 Tax=Alteriqipengyuania lutimaris TaxID=1538146 RepID=A0A395LH87_9SPHN|nr:prolyl oligopeptidase family serine peptidase [Alteriqipengyuania lutimaris]MBB3035419.1 dipeptidyl aminopeptidase/acylaminoacyl peptidase [Alteriqipengyuania lutimaris]RDS75995.1 S9 family peptidase [Alteriqipengyuania lutimaris]